MIQPRSYQIEAVNSLWSYFHQNFGNPVVAMPTGTGKALVIAMFVQSVFKTYSGQRILMLTHVKELVQQNKDELVSLWNQAPVGIYSAGLNKREAHMPITFAGIGSVAKKAKHLGRIDLVLIDEAHRVTPSEETMYQRLLGDLRKINPMIKVIGFTATPWQQGSGYITNNGIFTDICFDITGLEPFNRLIKEGFLSPLVPRRTKLLLKTDGVHTRGGDFVQGELERAVNKEEITAAALGEVLNEADDRNHWLVFASGVDHALAIADMLTDMGVPAIAIHSNMKDTERDDAIDDFKAGKYRAAVNNNILTTGFNFPAIDCIVMLRPTQSVVLWVQMLGRGTRTFPGKQNCLVLDFAANSRRLGPINDPVLPRKKGEKGGPPPVKECDSCSTYNHPSAKVCECCGAEFSFAVKIKATAAEDELIRQKEVPVEEVFKVDLITYSMHEKTGRPPSIKVSYFCGLRVFNEFVCLEHEGFAGRKAREWWAQRWDVISRPVPTRTVDALSVVTELLPATHVRVWINQKYPSITATCLDGTAFGSIEPTGDKPQQQASEQTGGCQT